MIPCQNGLVTKVALACDADREIGLDGRQVAVAEVMEPGVLADGLAALGQTEVVLDGVRDCEEVGGQHFTEGQPAVTVRVERAEDRLDDAPPGGGGFPGGAPALR